ncbi:hypothetical protein QJS10_CPA05g01145 [Acorus calamus]|uniref:Secreted protein n=1 Tax=Acorus calamus TaxID=4465 RepID=A0AAV9ESP5_ACOCL|nr:hypothetical protein QJS10_CPA05g01145 [Acorus calamus]
MAEDRILRACSMFIQVHLLTLAVTTVYSLKVQNSILTIGDLCCRFEASAYHPWTGHLLLGSGRHDFLFFSLTSSRDSDAAFFSLFSS